MSRTPPHECLCWLKECRGRDVAGRADAGAAASTLPTRASTITQRRWVWVRDSMSNPGRQRIWFSVRQVPQIGKRVVRGRTSVVPA
eukprot:356777-Chlamydomonas_euryale.AAC.4